MVSEAIIGDLSIEASDGTVLHATNDLSLAWYWAEHEHLLAGTWHGLTYGEQCSEVSDALTELRRAHGGSE